jgi:nitroreductase
MRVTEALEQRRAIKIYEEGQKVSDAQLRELFSKATLAPSSFNLQFWQFLIVRDEANKQKLMEAAYNQPQVGQCSAAIVVVADPEQWKNARTYWENSGMSGETLEKSVEMITNSYQGNPDKARDEAIRSVGLVGMAIMLKATEMGLATGPMIGFDPDEVAKHFDIEAPKFPAMLIVMGHEGQGARKRDRPWRRELSEVVRLESLSGKGLE